MHFSRHASISCTSEALVWSCSHQGQQQNFQTILEQDETNHDNFSVCLYIEAKANYYYFLTGDTLVSPCQWVKERKKKRKKKNGNECHVNPQPDTHMETACKKRSYATLQKRDFLSTSLSPMTYVTSVTLSVAGKLDKAERPTQQLQNKHL